MSKESAVKNHEAAAPPALSQEEILRYSRHLIMPEVRSEERRVGKECRL